MRRAESFLMMTTVTLMMTSFLLITSLQPVSTASLRKPRFMLINSGYDARQHRSLLLTSLCPELEVNIRDSPGRGQKNFYRFWRGLYCQQ